MSDDNTPKNKVLDKILDEIGVGKFHFINFAVIFIPAIFIFNSELTYVFTTHDSNYRCAVPECDSQTPVYQTTWLKHAIPYDGEVMEKCGRYALNTSGEGVGCSRDMFDNDKTIPCTAFVFEDSDSIVDELNIPCEDWKRSLVGTANSAGQLVSLLFSGVISDKYGRKIVLTLMTLLRAIAGIIQSFSVTYWMYLALEFVGPSVSAGAYCTIYIMIVEFLPTNRRIHGCALFEIFVTLSFASVGLFAWATNSWRWLLRVSYLPLFLIVVSYFVIPESFRWLYAKGHYRKCVKILEKAAQTNGQTLSRESLTELDIVSKSAPEIEQESNISIRSLIKSRILSIRIIICAFCWLSCELIYSGLTINSVNISGNLNIYLDYSLSALIEIPSILVYLLILRFFKRKLGLALSFLGSGIFSITYAFIPTLSIYLISKFFITIAFALLYIYTTEVFPTNLRNSSLNICSVFGCIGGMLAPQVLLMVKIHQSIPMVVFGVLPILTSIVVWKLVETQNVKLPDTMEEAENM